MIFESLTLCGIKSFREKQTFYFPSGIGLFFMFGENTLEPYLGSNGTGKSSTWDGLFWVLYGKTLRGLRAGDVRSWRSKGPYYANLSFVDDNGNSHDLYRSMDPNSLLLDGTEISQEDLSGIIKVPFESSLYSVVFGQKNSKFFDLKPAEALKLFTEILELDVWLERSDRASKKFSELSNSRSELQGFFSETKGKVEALEEGLEGYSQHSKTWAREQKKKIKDKAKELRNNKKKVVYYEEALSKIEQHKESLDDNVGRISANRDAVQQRIGILTTHVESFSRQIGEALGRQEVAKKNYTHFRRFHNTGRTNKCGVCLQPITEEHFNRRLMVLKKEWREAGKPVAGLVDKRDKYQDELKDRKRELKKIDRKYQSCQGESREVDRDKERAEHNLSVYKNREEDDKKQLEGLKQESSPFDQMSTSAKEELALLKRKLGLFKRQLQYHEKEMQFAKYWVKGFKEVRLFLISEFLSQFEIEANNCLSRLGMEDWLLSFEVETATKSNTIKKGFSVFVDSPYNETPVPWESWSGGEAQRLTLSGSIGLSDLILNRYEASSNIEVWDEPSSWLSEEGIRDLLNTLFQRSRQENKQIWVTDQRFLEYGDFDGMVTVVKDKKGSHFKWHT